MSGSDTVAQKVKRYLHSLPGKRGIDIPEDHWDRIHEAAAGETLPVWGRHPTPEQMQHMYDNKIHEPAHIKEFYGNFPHPHVPNVKVSEYPSWSKAYETYRRHGGKLGGG